MVSDRLAAWHGVRTHDPRRLVLGSAQWGMPYGIANRSGPPSDAALAAMLRRARVAGLRTIDTARAYGESEARIGHLLASFAGSEPWRVVTKLGPDVHAPGLGIAESLERTAESLARSRAALGLEVLPVLLLHRFAHRHACGGKLWRTLLAERDAGRIGQLGVSAATPEEAWAALEDPDVEVLQVAASLLDLRLYRQGFFDRARDLGRTIYVRSLFLQGVAHLEPRTLPPALEPLAEPLRTIRAAARALDQPARRLHLAFARELLAGCLPVVGCETEAQVAELVDDWAAETPGAGDVASLVAELPTHDAALVDPSRWPADERRDDGAAVDPDPDPNRPPSGSVATIPR